MIALDRISFSWLAMLFLLTLLLLSTPCSMAGSHTPMGVVRSGTDQALEILKTRHATGHASLRERREEVFQIVDRYFSISEMAKRALGRPWKEQSPEKQKEFVELFKQLLFSTYVDRVDNYAGGQAGRVLYDGEMLEGRYALVKTRLVGYRQNDVIVEYRLYGEDGEWKVYDVVVEGISFINNYRQQFNSILANESFDALLNRMREKVVMQSH